MHFKIEIINTSNPHYTQELELRDIVLRQPLGLSIKNDDLSKEGDWFHFVAIVNDRVIGVVVLTPAEQYGKLRQMAVSEEFQGMAIGKKLVKALETHALVNGIKTVKLNARHYAVGFYEKLGYSKTEKPIFQEVGIDHYEMVKYL
ncbi:MAG: GNAT family N-acetyltransferase [Cytophagales bacterium]|nr:GNAT family N-acetyltransferase [Cytophagales bacterium]